MKVLKEFFRLKWEERKTIGMFFLISFAIVVICFVVVGTIIGLAYWLNINQGIVGIILSITTIFFGFILPWLRENWRQAKENVNNDHPVLEEDRE